MTMFPGLVLPPPLFSNIMAVALSLAAKAKNYLCTTCTNTGRALNTKLIVVQKICCGTPTNVAVGLRTIT